MLHRESQASTLQRRNTTAPVTKFPLCICYIHAPRTIASQKSSYSISSSTALLRLCSAAGSASTHSLLVVSTHPNLKGTQPYLVRLCEATRMAAVDTGEKDF